MRYNTPASSIKNMGRTHLQRYSLIEFVYKNKFVAFLVLLAGIAGVASIGPSIFGQVINYPYLIVFVILCLLVYISYLLGKINRLQKSKQAEEQRYAEKLKSALHYEMIFCRREVYLSEPPQDHIETLTYILNVQKGLKDFVIIYYSSNNLKTIYTDAKGKIDREKIFLKDRKRSDGGYINDLSEMRGSKGNWYFPVTFSDPIRKDNTKVQFSIERRIPSKEIATNKHDAKTHAHNNEYSKLLEKGCDFISHSISSPPKEIHLIVQLPITMSVNWAQSSYFIRGKEYDNEEIITDEKVDFKTSQTPGANTINRFELVIKNLKPFHTGMIYWQYAN